MTKSLPLLVLYQSLYMFQPDDIIGPYKLIRYLGGGQFGVVWLAQNQEVLSPPRALKLFTDPELDWEVVKKEACVWLEVSGHPNILPLIEASEHNGQIVIVSEYAAGGSLAKWISDKGGKAPSIAKAIEMMLGILAGLEHLHGRNIVHRDLKPANVLLQGESPRLADFGLSRVMSSTHHSNWSGTLEYSPPESFDDFYDNKTDIWAAGVLLYRLLSGRLPFPQGNQAALMGAIMNKPPNPLPPDIPAPLQKIVLRALEKKMADRFQLATEMRQALLQVNHSPTPPKTVQPEPPPRRNIIQIDFDPPPSPKPAPPKPAPLDDDGPTRVILPKPYLENLNGVPLEMILVPAGKFMMGGDKHDSEEPPHEVTVPSFYIGKFQITQKQWQAVMGNNPSHFKGDDLPVESVSWQDAQSFCEKLRAMTERAYRLPSEAEWEYACRAGTTGDYAGKLDEMGWYGNNSGKKVIDAADLWKQDNDKYYERIYANGCQTHPVGQKKANAFGLYDMHGNLWEWCEDLWHANYDGAPKDGSAWTDGGNSKVRVLRGGSWGDDGDSCHSASRDLLAPDYRSDLVGFRVVVTARTS